LFRIIFVLALLWLAIRALWRMIIGVSERWIDVYDTRESLARRNRKLDVDESQIEDADFKEIRDEGQR